MTQRVILDEKEFDFSSGRYHQYERGSSVLSGYWAVRTKMLEETKAFFPDGARYLGNILNDSPIISINYRKHDYIRITFNDIRYLDFCWAIMDLENIRIPYRKWVFPIVLEFSGLSKCLMHWCNRNQKLLPLKTEKYLGKLFDFQEDEIQEVGEGFISLALHFLTTMKGHKDNMILHIVAESLSVKEAQQEALNGLVDRKYAALLGAFQVEVSNRILGDTSVIKEWIKKNRHLIGD